MSQQSWVRQKGYTALTKNTQPSLQEKVKGTNLTSRGITFTGFKNYYEKLIQIREMSDNYLIMFKYRNKMLL